MQFSIIIPVYNASTEINRCVQSILAQTCRDYEVLLIDDGSTDDSWAILQQLDRDYPFIHSRQITHGGPGKARNVGLDHAAGDYILFMDADDYWLSPDLLATLQTHIARHATDVFMYQMIKVTESGTVLERYRKPPFMHENMVLKLKDVYADLVADGQVLASACNKCINHQLLTKYQIRFRENINGEDIDWVLQLFSYVRTICLMNTDAYAYTQHKTSSRSSQKELTDDLFTIIEDWSLRLQTGRIAHTRAVAGMVAFEYGICMGNIRYMSKEKRAAMPAYLYLLKYGLDRKTRLIYRFYRIFGYRLACTGIRTYLLLRRIW